MYQTNREFINVVRERYTYVISTWNIYQIIEIIKIIKNIFNAWPQFRFNPSTQKCMFMWHLNGNKRKMRKKNLLNVRQMTCSIRCVCVFEFAVDKINDFFMVWQYSSCHISYTSNIIFPFHLRTNSMEWFSFDSNVGSYILSNVDYAESKCCENRNVTINICVWELFAGIIVAVNKNFNWKSSIWMQQYHEIHSTYSHIKI